MFKRMKMVVTAVAGLALCFTLSQNLYAATVGGTSTGFLNIKKIECKNKTTKQKVKVAPTADGEWNCEKAGLIVNAGDVIKMELKGTAQGLIPDQPQNGTATGGSALIVLQWSPVENAKLYSVYRNLQPNVLPSVATKLADTTQTNYIDNSITADVTYYFVITASNDEGESNTSADIAGITNSHGLDHSTLSMSCDQSGCHDGLSAVGKPANHIPTTSQCDSCHATASWIPASFDHVQVQGVCSDCHIIPRGHPATTNNCDACHVTRTWTPVANVDHSQVFGMCLECHRMPAGHMSTTVNCEACHITSAWWPVAFVEHNEVLGTCSSCHDGMIASGRSITHIPDTGNCEACHNVNAWAPVVTIDHSEVIGACIVCHDGRVTTGKPPLHVTSSDACEQCHDTTSWITIAPPPPR